MKLNDTDTKILSILQRDGRITNAARNVAERVRAVPNAPTERAPASLD